MHSIRTRARRSAWYYDGGDSTPTYNIFGRVHSRPRYPVDEENQLRHVSSVPQDPVSPTHDRDDARTLRRSHTDPLPSQDRRDSSAAHESGEDEWDSQVAPEEKPPATAFADFKVDGVEKTKRNKTDGGILRRPAEADSGPRKRRERVGFALEKRKTEESEATGECKSSRSAMCQFKAIFGTWVNLLLPFVPAGFAVNYTHQRPVTIFIVNFFAIIPSSAMIAFAIEEVIMHVGHIFGGLLSMTFSNSVQLISSIFLLKARQVAVLRAALLGAILQTLLVITGLAFLLGGFNRDEQYFNARIAQTISMLLLLAVLSLTVPTVAKLWGHTSEDGVLSVSRGTAVVIMMSYALWLVFCLKTNRALFREESPKAPKKPSGKKDPGEALRGIAMIGAANGAAMAGGAINAEGLVQDPAEEEETPNLGKVTAVVTLVVFTALLAFNVEFATNSVQGIMAEHHVSVEFMGIVILPILSNETLPIDCAIRDRMDRSIALTLERCMQTCLMVVPLVVLISWGLGIDDMNLDFDGFSVAAVFASIIIVSYVVQEGKSNWLTGALLLKVFVIIGLASFYVNET